MKTYKVRVQMRYRIHEFTCDAIGETQAALIIEQDLTDRGLYHRVLFVRPSAAQVAQDINAVYTAVYKDALQVGPHNPQRYAGTCGRAGARIHERIPTERGARMKNETNGPITSVIFRRWRAGGKSAIAYFPYLPDDDGLVVSYEHVGQHGGASLSVMRAKTIPASTSEPDVMDLYKELQALGYRMRVIKRVSYR